MQIKITQTKARHVQLFANMSQVTNAKLQNPFSHTSHNRDLKVCANSVGNPFADGLRKLVKMLGVNYTYYLLRAISVF